MPLPIHFTKMHALGNDFVILELDSLTPAQIRWIADRRHGIGCDQIILVKKSSSTHATLSFFNADGREALACGNGTRCVAKYLEQPTGSLQTPSFLSHFERKDDTITITLKPPSFFPSQTLSHLNKEAYQIDVGNPHLVIFAENIDKIPLEELALSLQPPDGINVELAEIVSPTTVKVRVWERGVGITPACGTGACAVGILSLKLGLIKTSSVCIEMEGGSLEVEWDGTSPPRLTGPATYCFKGSFDLP